MRGEREIRGREAASSVAMTITLLSLAMLFASLMLVYALLRFNSVLWPPMGMSPVDVFFPVISSTLIAFSSLCYIKFERYSFTLRWLYGALIFGVGFLVSQVIFWRDLKESGFYVSAGIFPSLVYGLTWIHGAHLLLALFFLLYLVFKRGKFKSAQSESLWVRNVGKFWHFLGVVWFFLYVSIFVF